MYIVKRSFCSASQCCWVLNVFIGPALWPYTHTTSESSNEQHLFVLLNWICQIQVSKMLQISFFVIITMSITCTYSVIAEFIHQIWFWAAYVFVAIWHTWVSVGVKIARAPVILALLICSHMEIKHKYKYNVFDHSL